MPCRTTRNAIMAGLVFALAACAERVPEPVAVVAPPVVEVPPPKPKPVARVRRPDPGCAAAKVDLPQDRKEALFRQFDAALGPAAAAVPVAATPAPAPPDCHQVSR